MSRPPLDLAELKRGVLARERLALGRALTLVESRLPAHREQARQLLGELAVHAAPSQRVGITGPPGAGKSTLIETLGLAWIESGHHVGVLAIDPSSQNSGGSILGDKTRMERLGQREEAFLRPTPSSGTLGGVARRTREGILLLEAAGYSRIIVETVGVGQSETSVSHLVDTVLLVALPGAGDEIQGIKRGLMETADLVFVNKAEGDRAALARQSANQISLALRLLSSRTPEWSPAVLTGSALSGLNIDELMAKLEKHRRHLAANLALLRGRQSLHWFHRELEDGILGRFYALHELRLRELEELVSRGTRSPEEAAAELLNP